MTFRSYNNNGGNNGGYRQNQNQNGYGGNRDAAAGGAAGTEQQGRFFRRPRVPEFVLEQVNTIDYKQVDLLRWFVNENGRIKPRRQTGLTGLQQRIVCQAIKRARHMALLSFVGNVAD